MNNRRITPEEYDDREEIKITKDGDYQEGLTTKKDEDRED